MNGTRWLDHWPPWIALLALATSGLFDPGESVLMGIPLTLAAVVEWQRWDLSRWRRFLELGALAITLLMGLAHFGLLQLLACLLFLLSGIRLALPRSLPQHRQLLLMGFLAFLMAAMSLPSLDFALWTILWAAGVLACLAHQAWTTPRNRLPFRQLWKWLLAVCLIAAGCFLGLPRAQSGNPLSAWGVRGFGAGAGLSDSLDLSDRGPLQPQSGVALRIVPKAPLSPSQQARMAQHLALLKGFTLEALEGIRWDLDPRTPPRQDVRWAASSDRELPGASLEVQIAPISNGLIPLPYGALTLRIARAWLLGPRPGGGIGWATPPRHAVSMDLFMGTNQPEQERLPRDRKVFLCETGGGTECALRWSRQIVPEDLPASELAVRLSSELQSYRYTLSNPSGRASNPLQDFLEHTRSGHCEYFASALACALRQRGVPARVVVGYRLGPWVPEGGYWLVTQNEAHSWVEFYEAGSSTWRIADPTPATPRANATGWLARLRRLQDVLAFRWDRYVLRFSGKEQIEGLGWAQKQAGTLKTAIFDLLQRRGLEAALLAACILGLALWLAIRQKRPPYGPGSVRELTPLLRKTRRFAPPGKGETARTWLRRLATLVPNQRDPLMELAHEVDFCIYGAGSSQKLALLAKKISREMSIPRPRR